MANKIKFLAYSAEIYKREKGLTGSELYALFAKYNVWEYLFECFEYLHTVGSKTTIYDIDKYIEKAVG